MSSVISGEITWRGGGLGRRGVSEGAISVQDKKAREDVMWLDQSDGNYQSMMCWMRRLSKLYLYL